MNVDLLQRAFETAAVAFAALSGVVDARRKNLDIVGAYVVALLTAFGGGTLRDVLLDRRPLFWVERWTHLVVVLVLALAYFYVPAALRPLRFHRARRFTELLDALALGLFGSLGCRIALIDCGSPAFVAVLFGVMTGTFGGLLRDVVVNEVPLLFRPVGHYYATASFAGCLALVGLVKLGFAPSVAMPCGAALTIALRLASLRFDWRVPAPKPEE